MTESPRLPTLMLVTDRTPGGRRRRARARPSLRGGWRRERRAIAGEGPRRRPNCYRSRRLREVTGGRALLLVNGPLEVALEAGADGVHLPEDAPLVERPSTGSCRPFECTRWRRRSALSPRAPITWWQGPVYATRLTPRGPRRGRRAYLTDRRRGAGSRHRDRRITAERTPEVIRAGAAGVAVISAILGAETPSDAARRR